MLRKSLALAAAMLVSVSSAQADGRVYVQVPDVSAIHGSEAEALLEEVVLANVVSSNCPDFAVTNAEWALLVDTADWLARGQLRLSVDDYDGRYYGPAFAALDQPDTCAEEGPEVQPLLDRLVEMGGSREPLPDQDAAYAAHQAQQAEWDAAPTAPPAGKKSKDKTSG